jgi:hypothetical protein
MPLGHGSIAEFAVASVRGGGVQNVGSPFISGSSFAASVNDLESVTGTASISQSGSSLASTFSIGTETVTGTADVTTTTAGVITSGLGEETPFGESFQNLITFSTGSPNLFIWSEVDDSQTVTWTDVEPGSTD